MTIYDEAGRKGKKCNPEEEIITLIQQTHDYIGDIGISKLWALVNKQRIERGESEVSHYLVEKIVKELYPEQVPNKPKHVQTRCRYLVQHPNSIWHGDIHIINLQGAIKYLYACIDDNSRFITCAKLLDDKSSQSVAQAFEEACYCYGQPLVYWSDNGGENIGKEMQTTLEKYRVFHVRTKPGNPQSNGKIERWWQNLHLDHCHTWEEIMHQIQHQTFIYNSFKAHSELPKINGYNGSPSEIYFRGERKTNIDEETILIDNKEVNLGDFLNHSHNPIPYPLRITTLLN